MLTTTTDVPVTDCRICGYPRDAATALEDGATPTPGDIDLCLNCGAVSIFTADLGVRPPTVDERAQLPNDAVTVIAAIKTRGRFWEA